MAAAQSKRHAARNERALQELLQSDAANNLCADCGARNPGWASWNVSGLFICVVDYLTEQSVVGDLPLHAMRVPPPEAGNPHLESQIIEHGQLDE
jgi:hypothetical protein